ncbi:DMT family transporter [Microbaculum marinisediminis]|nr:DMT family transporter [Microbaculum sp. A6E488]
MQHLIGIGFRIASAMVLVVMAAMVKYLTTSVPIGELMFARSFFALPPLVVWMAFRREFPFALKTRRFKGHMLRGAFGAAAMAGYFVGLSYLPLPDMTAIWFVAPLLTLALATVMLGETVGLLRWSAVGIGFLGVILILSPHLGSGISAADDAAIGAVIGFAGAALTALAMIQVRQLTGTETTAAIVFYFSVTATLFSLLTLPFGWVVPDGRTALLLVAIGTVGGVGQILLTLAYRYAPVSVIAPFDYTAMIWSLLIGYVVFGEVPYPIVLVGSAIVIGAGLFVIWREHQLGIKRERQRKASPPPV